ncbi:hypothetical protein BO94DRAFT_587218 [Aspergillus sclerotioniger CBS 115572]|uniref:Uncharacterized protein n=1 Tax=Aspergillus sclerotioniger CBS 115572 TaxID=1450535 RepID=A0A317W643_9EURO|nr:hypothetical protein BO94DRAFT_587218 [Aspergillus sclerotioniger CBS 115572]PWY81505.1 hypothetical protein BO94DRAFT_587218 [Aspergillus sclerotioniger CBS 115572]
MPPTLSRRRWGWYRAWAGVAVVGLESSWWRWLVDSRLQIVQIAQIVSDSRLQAVRASPQTASPPDLTRIFARIFAHY